MEEKKKTEQRLRSEELQAQRKRREELLREQLSNDTASGLRNTPLIAISQMSMSLAAYATDFAKDYLLTIATAGTEAASMEEAEAILSQLYLLIKIQGAKEAEQMAETIATETGIEPQDVKREIVQASRKEQAGLKYGGYLLAVDLKKIVGSIYKTKHPTAEQIGRIKSVLKDIEAKRVISRHRRGKDTLIVTDSFLKQIKSYRSNDGATDVALYYLSPVFRAVCDRRELSINGY